MDMKHFVLQLQGIPSIGIPRRMSLTESNDLHYILKERRVLYEKLSSLTWENCSASIQNFPEEREAFTPPASRCRARGTRTLTNALFGDVRVSRKPIYAEFVSFNREQEPELSMLYAPTGGGKTLGALIFISYHMFDRWIASNQRYNAVTLIDLVYDSNLYCNTEHDRTITLIDTAGFQEAKPKNTCHYANLVYHGPDYWITINSSQCAAWIASIGRSYTLYDEVWIHSNVVLFDEFHLLNTFADSEMRGKSTLHPLVHKMLKRILDETIWNIGNKPWSRSNYLIALASLRKEKNMDTTPFSNTTPTSRYLPETDAQWEVLGGILRSYIQNRVYTFRPVHWYGAERELVEDILCETILHAISCAQHTESSTTSSMLSFEALCKIIAKRYLLDIRRKDKRLAFSIDTIPYFKEHQYRKLSDDPTDNMIEDMFVYSKMHLIAKVVKDFTPKLKEAMLIRLTNMVDFDDEQPYPLERAMWTASIPLRDSYRELPDAFVLRSCHAASLCLACEHTRYPCAFDEMWITRLRKEHYDITFKRKTRAGRKSSSRVGRCWKAVSLARRAWVGRKEIGSVF